MSRIDTTDGGAVSVRSEDGRNVQLEVKDGDHPPITAFTTLTQSQVKSLIAALKGCLSK